MTAGVGDRSLVLLLVVSVSAVAAFAERPQRSDTVPPPQTTPFRAGVDAVTLTVTVTDSANHPISDMEAREFLVFEDGVEQAVTFFLRQSQPIALSLLLDSSASMTPHLPTLQSAATHFIRQLGPNDLAEVVDFDGNVRILQAFTANHVALDTAIRQLVASGSTALYNAIYISLRGLEKVDIASDQALRRRALVVFSDGEDTSSVVTFDQMLELAKRSGAAIYTVGLRSMNPAVKSREAEWVLRTLAYETGGRAFFPEKIDELTSVYSMIADEIASQYVLGYTSSNATRNGAWRRVQVRLSRPNTTARTKSGYFAPNERR